MVETHRNKRDIIAYVSIGIYLIIGIVIAFLLDGTGDAGDSLLHYHYARYAFEHPYLFFHHWGKPMFILIAAPFSQFGFYRYKSNECIDCLTYTLAYL